MKMNQNTEQLNNDASTEKELRDFFGSQHMTPSTELRKRILAKAKSELQPEIVVQPGGAMLLHHVTKSIAHKVLLQLIRGVTRDAQVHPLCLPRFS